MNAATVQVLMEGRKKTLVTSGKVATFLNIEDSVGTILAALVRFRTSLSVLGHFVLFECLGLISNLIVHCYTLWSDFVHSCLISDSLIRFLTL